MVLAGAGGFPAVVDVGRGFGGLFAGDEGAALGAEADGAGPLEATLGGASGSGAAGAAVTAAAAAMGSAVGASDSAGAGKAIVVSFSAAST